MSDTGVSQQRLAQRSIGYRSLEMAARLGWILLFVTFGSSQLLAAWQTGLLIAGGLLAAGGYQFVFWRRFEYELTEDTFDIRSGVFSRRTREIPLDRVQNVDLQRNVFQQAVGLTEVRLETAGGSTTEATLRFVTEAEAARLREAISRQKRAAGTEPTAEAESVAGEQPPAEERHETLFEISPRELGLLGLISVDLRLLSILTVVLPLVLPSVGRRVGGEGPLMSDPLVAFALGAPIAAFFIVFVTAIVSGVFTLTNYWGFQLRRGAEELLYDRGLLQKFSGTIPLEKVQAFAISENVLARRLGYASLSVETAGYGPGDSSGSQSAVPIARRDRVLELARSVDSFEEIRFDRPPGRARYRYFLRYLLVVGGVVTVAYLANRFTGFAVAWQYAAGLVVLAPIGAHLKWANLGYAVLDTHLVTRTGFWTRETRIIPYFRVQTLIQSSSLLQRRRNLSTVVADTAGSGGLGGSNARAVDIDAREAEELRSTIERRFQQAVERGPLSSRTSRRQPGPEVGPSEGPSSSGSV